jgi:hypothetical protein
MFRQMTDVMCWQKLTGTFVQDGLKTFWFHSESKIWKS